MGPSPGPARWRRGRRRGPRAAAAMRTGTPTAVPAAPARGWAPSSCPASTCSTWSASAAGASSVRGLPAASIAAVAAAAAAAAGCTLHAAAAAAAAVAACCCVLHAAPAAAHTSPHDPVRRRQEGHLPHVLGEGARLAGCRRRQHQALPGARSQPPGPAWPAAVPHQLHPYLLWPLTTSPIPLQSMAGGPEERVCRQAVGDAQPVVVRARRQQQQPPPQPASSSAAAATAAASLPQQQCSSAAAGLPRCSRAGQGLLTPPTSACRCRGLYRVPQDPDAGHGALPGGLEPGHLPGPAVSAC